MPYVFGVDGGGSTCRAILITESGRVVFYGKGAGVNYHEVGASTAVRTIEKLYQEALSKARARKDECIGIGLGLAGAGRAKDQEILTPLFHDAFGNTPFLLTTDADIALTSGTLSDSGIIVIAGTGAMIYGRNEAEECSRVGGYGPLVSDEGGGYRIGLEALRRVVRAYDGCDLETLLSERILAHFELKTFEDLISWVNSAEATREQIASIAPLVMRAATENDPVADELMNEAADALAIGVEALHQRLQFPDRFEVVLSGGLLTNSTNYAQVVRRKILYLLPGATITPPKMEPVFGAALFAYSLTGQTIDQDLLDTIQLTYREYSDRQNSTNATRESALAAASAETENE